MPMAVECGYLLSSHIHFVIVINSVGVNRHCRLSSYDLWQGVKDMGEMKKTKVTATLRAIPKPREDACV